MREYTLRSEYATTIASTRHARLVTLAALDLATGETRNGYAVEYRLSTLNSHLEGTLGGFSAKGSQDDVTICGLIDLGRVAPLVDSFQQHNELVIVQGQCSRIADRLASMSGKMDHLQKRYASARAHAEKAERQLEQLLEEQQVYSKELESMKPHVITLFESLFEGFRIILEAKHAWRLCSETESRLAKIDIRLEQARRSSDEAKQKLELAEKELREFEDLHAELEQDLAKWDDLMQELQAAAFTPHASTDAGHAECSLSAVIL